VFVCAAWGCRNCARHFHRLHGYRRTVDEAAEQHGYTEGKQHAEGVHLEDREVGDNEGDQRAEITKRARDFHSVKAIARWLRYGGIRCHGTSSLLVHRRAL
jgi:hypothetical protein